MRIFPTNRPTIKVVKKAATPRELPSERLGVPPTTPDVDAKVKAAEATQDAANGAAKTKEATTNASAGTGRDTGERGAKGGQPVAEGGKAMSLMDAAVNILSQGVNANLKAIFFSRCESSVFFCLS